MTLWQAIKQEKLTWLMAGIGLALGVAVGALLTYSDFVFRT